jgi:hypothetical protein
VGWNLDHLQTIMGTEFHATAAVDADERFTGRVQVDGIDRTSPGACPAANAEVLLDYHAAAPALAVGTRGACLGAGRRVAGQARLGLEAGGQTARRPDPDSRRVPGKVFVYQTGTGQGTGVTTDTPLHARRAQNFHTDLLGIVVLSKVTFPLPLGERVGVRGRVSLLFAVLLTEFFIPYVTREQ